MGKIYVTEFVSLDGVMEDPGGAEGYRHGGWSFRFNDPEGMKFKLDEALATDVLLLGRVTYEGFAAAWPGRTDEVGFAEKFNTMPKYVVSTTLKDPTWTNSTVIGPDEVVDLKQRTDGEIGVHGSRTLAQSLLRDGLVDEVRLMVHPILLGSGKRLFPESDDAIMMNLAESRTLDSGSLILRYEPLSA
jgi:dihydrofolate reductase